MQMWMPTKIKYQMIKNEKVLQIDSEFWKKNIEKRNRAVSNRTKFESILNLTKPL